MVALLFLSGRGTRSYYSGNSRGQSLSNISQEVERTRDTSLCFVFESQAELQRFAAETQAGATFLKPFGSLLSITLSADGSDCQNSEAVAKVQRNSDGIWNISGD
jgi:hypothetical protein